MAVFDISWGFEMYQRAKEKGIGQSLNLWDKPSLA
jgi:ornithine cyclodeaminase